MTANFHLRINRAIFKALVLTLFCTGLFNMAQAESRDQAIAVDYLQGEGDVQGLSLPINITLTGYLASTRA